NLMFRALRLDQLWLGSKSAELKRTIRVESKPSERDEEGYPTSMIAVLDLPARGELPSVKLTVYAKDKPSEELLLDHPRGAWVHLFGLPLEHAFRFTATNQIPGI